MTPFASMYKYTKYVKFFLISILFIAPIGGIVIAHDITREEFNNRFENIERDVDNLQNRNVDWQGIISANTTAIIGLQSTLDRVQDMLGNIFLLMLGSILSAIVGGSSLGYIMADRKRGEKQNE